MASLPAQRPAATSQSGDGAPVGQAVAQGRFEATVDRVERGTDGAWEMLLMQKKWREPGVWINAPSWICRICTGEKKGRTRLRFSRGC